MSVLVVGLSHKSAPVTTLERAVLTGDTLGKLLRDVFHADDVAGSLVVSTCNRVEVYAEVDKFHGGVAAICVPTVSGSVSKIAATRNPREAKPP